jgi:hypothetical protein
MLNTRFHLGCLVTFAMVICTGCDGYLGVEGRVYEAVKPKEGMSGFVMVDSLDRTLPAQLVPIEDAEIIVEPWRPEERSNIDDPSLFTIRTRTDSSGYFKIGSTQKPSKFDATITVRCPGFQEVQTVFLHNRSWHKVIVVLTRPAKADSEGKESSSKPSP